ncbi:hypothetical protein L6164_025869 [Bauhinia variegata]|uniref:Uncharacterized protein n=1 Tax=Bauhinia variegata TaxID=167791 RepID=A0ACB9M2W2_BAUVA|nr:hypothetical protein L6164_025869 [Bauhinia variegata]
MSASTIRRIKDRGGGGGDGSTTAVKAASVRSSRSITPVSGSAKISSSDPFQKSSSGKENRRSSSRGPASVQTQKPAIRPMPRVDKTSSVGAGNDGEVRERKSTSSVPRGRSSSPFEFNRVISDMRRERRVSVDRVVKGPSGEGNRSVFSGGKGIKESSNLEFANQRKGYRDFNVKGDTKQNGVKGRVNSEVKGGNSEVLEKKVGEIEQNKACLSSNLVRPSSVHVRGNSQIPGERVNSETELKVPAGVGIDGHTKELSSANVGKVGNGDSCMTESSEKSAGDVNVLGVGMEKAPGDEGANSGVHNKCPSRLHEKLAFLEGKVKRIASDIRRTKEMLDMNNPDTSKMILSDIQDKISGIEKAMVNVTGDSDAKVGFLKNSANVGHEANMVCSGQTKQADEVKSSVKGLNTDELEARLFPHHKLLRNRTSVKASSASCLSNESSEKETEAELKVEEKVLSPVDENSIAIEFLASLSKETSKVTSRDGQADMEYSEVQETDCGASAGMRDTSSTFNKKCDIDLLLASDEKLDDFDDQENKEGASIGEETEDTLLYSLNEIGNKTATGGWFVSEGEAVLLAHDDGSCSYYDIANSEEKAVYTSPSGVFSPNIWRDCWIVRAPGSDGCSGRFVVAASAGNTMDAGFCSWDFYSRDVRGFQVEVGTKTTSRRVLGPLPNNVGQRRNSSSNSFAAEATQWWYKPCGPLMISMASSQRAVKVFDIRDGEQIMKWDVQKPVLTMDYSSPLQWRNRGKVVVAETETISLWDVNSLTPQALLSIPSSGRKISALHVCNTDAELGGGVRQRVSSSEAEGNDGVFCTSDSINILDFRQPSGVGMRISKLGVNVQSVYSRGDSIFLGCTSSSSVGKKQSSSLLQQFSLRKQGLFSTYSLPESNAHPHHTAITQVWGNSNLVMGVSGLGLFVFDAQNDDPLRGFNMDNSKQQNVREVIGPDDLYWPSFDYLGSRALLISRDRPAMWRYLSV